MISLSAWAQNLEDVIYLKNGSVIRGTLIEQVPEVKIKTNDGSVWVFESDKIENITSEPKQTPSQSYGDDTYLKRDLMVQNKRRPSNTTKNLSHGMRTLVDFGYQQRTNQYVCSGITFGAVLGWQINSKICVGFGMADQAYVDYYYNGVYSEEADVYVQIPMFLDLRYDAKPGRKSPMADFRIGYAFSGDIYNDYRGFYMNPSLGFRLNRFTFAVGADLVKLREPWYVMELTYSKGLYEKEIKWQSSIQFRIQLEIGGRM